MFDNAGEPVSLKDLLPRSPLANRDRHHLILTSQSRHWGGALIPLGKLTVEEARLFVRTRLSTKPHCAAESDDVVDKLAKEVGHLPLALALACAYIEHFEHSVMPLTIAKYTAQLQKAPMDVLGEWKGIPPDYPYTAATTWSLSIQQLSDQALAVLGL